MFPTDSPTGKDIVTKFECRFIQALNGIKKLGETGAGEHGLASMPAVDACIASKVMLSNEVLQKGQHCWEYITHLKLQAVKLALEYFFQSARADMCLCLWIMSTM